MATLFLAGDVMTARGIDQILPHPGDAELFETHMRSALGYVALAEREAGPISRPVPFAYPWGEALAALRDRAPDLRIVNLETAVTARGRPAPKGINYRMNPANAGVLSAFGIDACLLANNHVLDWGIEGLADTLASLRAAGIAASGAGTDLAQATAPAVLPLPRGGRLLAFAFGHESSGIPPGWGAAAGRPGVALLPSLDGAGVAMVADAVDAARQPGDLVLLSLHWGPNWGYAVGEAERAFAHALVDRAGADLVHGHSAHHPKGIEVHRGRLVLYGCGDFLNDYEGIGGYEAFRSEIALGYLAELETDGRLSALTILPFRHRALQLRRLSDSDTAWIAGVLNREGAALGTSLDRAADGSLTLRWR